MRSSYEEVAGTRREGCAWAEPGGGLVLALVAAAQDQCCAGKLAGVVRASRALAELHGSVEEERHAHDALERSLIDRRGRLSVAQATAARVAAVRGNRDGVVLARSTMFGGHEPLADLAERCSLRCIEPWAYLRTSSRIFDLAPRQRIQAAHRGSGSCFSSATGGRGFDS